MAQVDSINIVQVGNGWDPYLLDNSFTLDNTGMTYTSVGSYMPSTYNYQSIITNSYEGCLLTLSWYMQYDVSNNILSVQVMRGTYTIQTHVNYMNTTGTEFQAIKNMISTSGPQTITQAKSYWPSCRIQNKYYFHPYLKFYFFLDRDTSYNELVVFTCFTYSSGPTSACDVTNLNTATAPTFKVATMNTYSTANGGIDSILETVAFNNNNAYVAARYIVTSGSSYQHAIYKISFTGSSCTNYAASLGTQIYATTASAASANTISSLKSIPNVGLAYTQNNVQGIWILTLDSTTGLAVGNPVQIETGAYWTLFQQSVDVTESPPLYAVKSTDPTSLYRITNIATSIYTNTSMDFYNYPVDIGRYHLMAIYPGLCSDALSITTINQVHATYLNLETKSVDFCNLDTPRTTCGNGILDTGETCDDGNSRNGDGCSSTCTIEVGWLCINTPYVLRSLCQPNECGDGYINTTWPYLEACDDGNTNNGDGCSSDCKTITPNWFCGRPGHACVHVCGNGILDNYLGPPYNLQAYSDVCDDGDENSGDGNLSKSLTK
jgi:cysteine-rich repeat protein